MALFAAEKLTMTDEFLPIGFILPVVSPAVFGGVLGGTVLTSLASTIAASFNFFLGRTVLKEKALALKWKDNPTVGDSRWFQALSRRFDSTQFPESQWPLTEGFKSALLLRLCPILPIPLSGNWYVCGMTPLKFPEFFAAHFIGSSKTAFVDAYLGSLLLAAALDGDAMKEQAQTVLVFETAALVIISIGVTTYATDLFTQILEEEGIDAASMMSTDEDKGGNGGGDDVGGGERKVVGGGGGVDLGREKMNVGGDGSGREGSDSTERTAGDYVAQVQRDAGGGRGGGVGGANSGAVATVAADGSAEAAAAKWAAAAFTPADIPTPPAAAAAVIMEAKADSTSLDAQRLEASLQTEIDGCRIERLTGEAERPAQEMAAGEQSRQSLLDDMVESDMQKEMEWVQEQEEARGAVAGASGDADDTASTSLGVTQVPALDYSEQEQAVLDAMDAAAAKALAASKTRRESRGRTKRRRE